MSYPNGQDRTWGIRAERRIIDQRAERIAALMGSAEPWARAEIARHREALTAAIHRLKVESARVYAQP